MKYNNPFCDDKVINCINNIFIKDISNIILDLLYSPVEFNQEFIEYRIEDGDYQYIDNQNITLVHHILQLHKYYHNKIYIILNNTSFNINVNHFMNICDNKTELNVLMQFMFSNNTFFKVIDQIQDINITHYIKENKNFINLLCKYEKFNFIYNIKGLNITHFESYSIFEICEKTDSSILRKVGFAGDYYSLNYSPTNKFYTLKTKDVYEHVPRYITKIETNMYDRIFTILMKLRANYIADFQYMLDYVHTLEYHLCKKETDILIDQLLKDTELKKLGFEIYNYNEYNEKELYVFFFETIYKIILSVTNKPKYNNTIKKSMHWKQELFIYNSRFRYNICKYIPANIFALIEKWYDSTFLSLNQVIIFDDTNYLESIRILNIFTNIYKYLYRYKLSEITCIYNSNLLLYNRRT